MTAQAARRQASEDRDPLTVITRIVQAADESIAAMVVAEAVARVMPRENVSHLRRLANILEQQPGLLTGDGARAPARSVVWLVSELATAGAQKIVSVPCPACDRAVRLHRRLNGLWSCGRCLARANAVPCSRCGKSRPVCIRDQDGQPVCSHCDAMDTRNHETCISCGRLRPVNTRTSDGPRCKACRPAATFTCAICGQAKKCDISRVTDRPWCSACRQRWAVCTACGEIRQVRAGTRAEPLCGNCAQPDPAFWRGCPTCGQREQLGPGPCSRCTLDQRLRLLLDNGSGGIRPELQAFYRNFAATARPRTALRWLASNTAAAVLADMAAGRQPLSHDTIDQLSHSPLTENLRNVLVATKALPARDDQLIRLQHWISQTLSDHTDQDEKQLLHRYAVWHLLRRLRQRNHGAPATYSQAATIRQHVRGAVVILGWLRERGLTLPACQQAHIDQWLASDDASHKDEAGHFIRWAISQRINPHLQFAATRWAGPTGPLDSEARWHQARRLMHDASLDTLDRAAGLLVLLYAQTPATICKLTTDDINIRGDLVTIRLGTTPVHLPSPLSDLVRDLAAKRRGRAVLGEDGSSPWLFPGARPGRPLAPPSLGQRLHRIGIRPRTARSTALFQLAAELPAAVLARILGIHVKVAAEWQKASAGDWAIYAADVSRRPRSHQ